MGMTFYGPIKYETFLKTHDIEIEGNLNATDVWIVDTEGFDVALSTHSKFYFQSILSFMPFFDFYVVVQKGSINTSMVEQAKQLMQFGTLLASSDKIQNCTFMYTGYEPTIMQRQQSNTKKVTQLLKDADKSFLKTLKELEFDAQVISFPTNELRDGPFEEAYWTQMYSLVSFFYDKVREGSSCSGEQFVLKIKSAFTEIIKTFNDPEWKPANIQEVVKELIETVIPTDVHVAEVLGQKM